MSLDAKIVEYYNFTVEGNAVEGFKHLSVFADVGINLLAFKAIPAEQNRTRYSLFPDDGSKMRAGAKKVGLNLDGPHYAILVKGYDDKSGACANVHERLAQAHVNVTESHGLADIRGSYGVVLYLKKEDREKALKAFSN
jgi:hypothetical protein